MPTSLRPAPPIPSASGALVPSPLCPAPDRAGTHRPPMKFWYSCAIYGSSTDVREQLPQSHRSAARLRRRIRRRCRKP